MEELNKEISPEEKNTEGSEYILEVENLNKYFTITKNILGKPLTVLKAVNDVSFKVKKGTTNKALSARADAEKPRSAERCSACTTPTAER